MNKPIKKIIAREGLVLLGFGVVLLVLHLYLFCRWIEQGVYYHEKVKYSALIAIAVFYSIYLLIRFIIWAIRISKGK